MTESSRTSLMVLPITTTLSDLTLKELCFEIWLYLADRNVDRTLEIFERQVEEMRLNTPSQSQGAVPSIAPSSSPSNQFSHDRNH